MRFARPEMLWLLVAVPVVALAWAWAAAARRRALDRFAGGPAQRARFAAEASPHFRAAKAILLAAALAAGITAAARPQWGARLEPVTRKGVDVVFLLDTSLSMAAADAPPDRLGQAKHVASELIERLGGDRVALVSFAGKAVLLCPLTLDHEAARLFLDAVDLDASPVPGTALAGAVDTAVKAFGARSAGESRGRALIVISDGEDHEGGLEAAVRTLHEGGVTAFAIGVGSEAGAPIPVNDATGRRGDYKRDRQGRLVTTRRDEAVLSRLAADTGGRYFRATAGEVEVDEIEKALRGMDSTESATVLRTRYEDRYQIPLAVALALLAIEAVLPERRRRGAAGAARRAA